MTNNYFTHDYLLYCSWDMGRDRCNCCFSFWAIFCPFTPVTAQRMIISKKWKKTLEISSLYKIVLKFRIIGCIVPEIWRVTDVIANFHFGLFLHFYPAPPSLTAQKMKIKKNEKNAWRYHYFTRLHQKLLDDVRLLRFGARRTDGKSNI